MFDFLNPALREAKKRAKEEYNQRMLQGKIDEAMRHAREQADRDLQRREWWHREKWRYILTIVGGLIVIMMIAKGKL